MTQAASESEASFKDYCLILQIHPEADAGMIEAAYWHLARRYNEQSAADPLAKQKLEDLNEAYSVMGNPTRREEYVRTRDQVLGAGTLPQVMLPPRESPPLAVMEKQRPRAREERSPKLDAGKPQFQLKIELRLDKFVRPSWHNTLAVLAGLLVTLGLFVASASQALVLAALAGTTVASASPILWLIARSDLVHGPSRDDEPGERLRDLSSRRFR